MGVFVDEELVAQYLEGAPEGYILKHPRNNLPEGAIGEFVDVTFPVLLQFSLELLETLLRTF